MNRRLPASVAGTVLVVALAAMAPATGLAQQSLAQGVFPPPPPPGSNGIITGAPSGLTGEAPVTARPVMGGPSAGGPPPGTMTPEAAAKCQAFIKLSAEAKARADLIKAGGQKHIDRKAMCGLVKTFYEAESNVVKFLVDNKTLCGVPEEAIKTSKANHEQSAKFRDNVCSEGPSVKKPTLSDAIGTPTLDTEKNTKTGKNGGTFNTLTGNPLGR